MRWNKTNYHHYSLKKIMSFCLLECHCVVSFEQSKVGLHAVYLCSFCFSIHSRLFWSQNPSSPNKRSNSINSPCHWISTPLWNLLDVYDFQNREVWSDRITIAGESGNRHELNNTRYFLDRCLQRSRLVTGQSL